MKIRSTLMLLTTMTAMGLAGCMYKDGANRTADSGSGNSYGARVGQSMDNSMLTSRVKTALATHSSLKTLILNVDSDNGVVTINGTVKSREIFDSVSEVASAVDGVKSLRNRLVINSGY